MSSFEKEELTVWPTITTYFSYGVIIMMGHVMDFLESVFGPCLFKNDNTKPGYAPMTRGWGSFYIRRVYNLTPDPWNRPITGPANNQITVLNRQWRKKEVKGQVLEMTGDKRQCINLSSYNYLGFAVLPPDRRTLVDEALDNYGSSMASSALNSGFTKAHKKLEKTVAEFLGVEAALCFGMGWGTNATALPALVGKGCLILSDSKNHASIVVGARSTGAKICPFKHNDVRNLEKVIVDKICYGQPETRRPWKKILIVIEGIYSMEGETSPLKQIIALKKKYNCYLYLDEAHSIGALGKNGRGLCDLTGCDPKDVDILMGTFTKSFGAIGGYIAGTNRLIESVRRLNASSFYSSGLSPVCTAMVQTAFNIIKDPNDSLGRNKLMALRENSNWFRRELIKLGFQVLGSENSPIIPIIIGNPGKLIAASRECLKRGLAVVVVGFPATSLVASRIRFCISAAHTRGELQAALDAFDEVGNLLHLKYKSRTFG